MVGTNVNLRNGPGTMYNIMTQIPAGSRVEVSGCRAGWCQVGFQGQEGYIIATSIAPPGGPGRPVEAGGPPPGYPPGYGPPPGYGRPPGYAPGYGPPPGYAPPAAAYPPPPPYYGYGPYYGPYRGWRRW
jgi:hypothetical protein